LLAALADQDIEGAVPVVVCLNNTTDLSRTVLENCKADYAGRLVIRIDEQVFTPELAHVGSARGRAMDLGLVVLGQSEAGVLLTTDADARPPQNWISENLRAIEIGADLVGGYLVIDEAEPLPQTARAFRELWERYWQKVRAIEDAIDPRPWDPPPRHGDHTGASLALTAKIYRAAGGVPPIPTGEDRGLVNAAIAAGGRLVHPLSVWMRVSPRQEGRAIDGMAKAMVELHEAAASVRTLMAPSLLHWRMRAAWRQTLRRRAGGHALIAREEASFPPMPCDTALAKIVHELDGLRCDQG
jgi:hypothetical protein